MNASIGKILTLTMFGESHGSHIGFTLSNLPSGITLDFSRIDKNLLRRRGLASLSTSRREKDEYQIISGYFNNKTTGGPLTIIIPNQDVDDKVYDDKKFVLRPGHADLNAYLKYDGYQDYRGGGTFSGRLTTSLVIAGSIASQILETKGIKVASRIKQIYDVYDQEALINEDLIDKLDALDFPTVSLEKAQLMQEVIIKAREEKDSLGGVIETYLNLNHHLLGEPWFDSLESRLSQYLFNVPALKGLSFGEGFNFASLKGSNANDEYEVRDDLIRTKTNHNGGIIGGIAKDEIIYFSSVIKPTPSIGKKQQSVNYSTKEVEELEIKGRHDPCIAPRALYVINALTSLCILDMMYEEYGKNYFKEDN